MTFGADGSPGDGLARPKASAWVFFILLAYFWIGLTPFPEISFADAAQAWANKSNVLNQVIVIVIAGAAFLLVSRDPARRLLFRPRWLFVLLLAWFVLTSLGADQPAIALRRVVFAALVCLMAGSMLLLPRSEEQFAKLLAIGVLMAIALSYFGVAFLPRLAIHQATDAVEAVLAGSWRGHFGHKNVAAAAMVIATFVGLYAAVAWSRPVGWLVVVAAVIFMIFTRGKTAMAMLPIVLLLTWAFEKWHWARLPIVVGGVGGANLLTIGAAFWPPIAAVVRLFGIDPTFTDRAAIWQLALSAIRTHPLTGYGFQAFWETTSLRHSGSIFDTWAVNAANSHNAYVEAAINAGLPGLALVVMWLVVLPMINVGRAEAAGNDPRLTRLFTRIWLYAIFSGCLESMFFVNTSPIWFSTLIAVFGLSLQARGQVVRSWDGAYVAEAARA